MEGILGQYLFVYDQTVSEEMTRHGELEEDWRRETGGQEEKTFHRMYFVDPFVHFELIAHGLLKIKVLSQEIQSTLKPLKQTYRFNFAHHCNIIK